MYLLALMATIRIVMKLEREKTKVKPRVTEATVAWQRVRVKPEGVGSLKSRELAWFMLLNGGGKWMLVDAREYSCK